MGGLAPGKCIWGTTAGGSHVPGKFFFEFLVYFMHFPCTFPHCLNASFFQKGNGFYISHRISRRRVRVLLKGRSTITDVSFRDTPLSQPLQPATIYNYTMHTLLGPGSVFSRPRDAFPLCGTVTHQETFRIFRKKNGRNLASAAATRAFF